MSPLESLPPDISRHRILDTKSACAFVGVSVANWRRLRTLGQAPAPIRIGSKKQGYRLGDLIDWIEARAESAEAA
jgi:predicted DNA-binding transcriptional regulator AlpA